MSTLWALSEIETGYPRLDREIDTEVVVIGAGITGLTTALCLAEAGKKVVVLEARRIGDSNTGRSTGNLYSSQSSGLANLLDKWDEETVRDVVAARARGVDAIEELVSRFHIECEFHRRPLYRLIGSGAGRAVEQLERERAAHRAAGFDLFEAREALGDGPVHDGFRIDDQAQFNPLRYIQSLAGAVAELGVPIFEQSRVTEVDHGGGVVRTEAGVVRARQVVHATHTPKGINLLQTAMTPSLEYGVAAPIAEAARVDGIFWLMDESLSIRGYRHGERSYLVAVGEKHKTGEDGERTDQFDTLYRALQARFPVEARSHQWSAQQFSARDGLPCIGQSPLVANAYVATGFGADGLVWGTVAAEIIADHITGRDNRWRKRFSARRFTPLKSAKEWVAENMHVSKHMIVDHLSREKLDSLASVQPGEARVVTLDGHKVAVRRDRAGELSVHSAICPHLKCVVHWNEAALTWDCPCHGSRFDTEGNVIEGPAYAPLKRIDVH